MKKGLLFVLASLIIVGTVQAQLSRLIGWHNKKDNGSSMESTDSSRVVYNNKKQAIKVTDILPPGHNRFDCDSLVGVQYGSGNWVRGGGFYTTYDAQGNIVMGTTLYPGSGNVRVNFMRHIYTYDAVGNIITDLTEYWDIPTSKWGASSRKVFVLNNGNIDTETIQIWTNNTWVNQQQYEYTYIGGLKTEYTNTVWLVPTAQLKTKTKTILSYNSNGHLNQLLVREYNISLAEYVDKSREIYTVDGFGNLLELLKENWRTSSWQPVERLKRIYNSKFENVYDTVDHWDLLTSKFSPQLMYEYTYDDSGNKISSVLRGWNNDSVAYLNQLEIQYEWNKFNQMTRERRLHWNMSNSQWKSIKDDYDNIYHYGEDAPTAIADNGLGKNQLKLYPVPAANVLTIKLSTEMKDDFTMRVTDISGRLLMQWTEKATANYTRQLPLYDMQPGNYFITINDGTQAATKVFSVVR